MITRAPADSLRSDFDSVEDIISAIRNGEMVVILDDEDRENEGDLVMAATKVRPEHINFMARYARALRAASAAVDGRHDERAAQHELHGIDRGGRGRHDGHLGA